VCVCVCILLSCTVYLVQLVKLLLIIYVKNCTRALHVSTSYTVVYVNTKAIALLSLKGNGALEVNPSVLFRSFCLILILCNF